ncbi:MAG: DNA polymerase III subunit gamma/tau [Bryobacteraceae bacterium]|nr:DNA polymerase III subunit gamma/tau [Bryobacteraceae bacterium]
MYQVIARKYRPQSFAELIGQEPVRVTLENAIAQGRIAHGYIFAGQRGTGKTTVARILARCLNCEHGPTAKPCGTCSSCVEISAGNSPDVIEIDAASNRGINEMRELRENVRYRPARDRYKVFIIDEAHQITNEAFNALLKTLEEPPDWVVFILCTTESHKIPTTIASRCQQFAFRSVDFPELIERMRWICAEEGIAVDDETLAALAQAGEGSVRDSLSALDQAIACCGNELRAEDVRALLGMFSLDSLEKVSAALAASDSAAMLDVVAELERSGHNLQHFCRELARFFRNLLVAKIAGANTRLIAASPQEQERLAGTAGRFAEDDLTRWLHLALEMFREMQYSLQPRFHLELGLLRLVHAGRMSGIEEELSKLGAVAPPAAIVAAKQAPLAPPPVQAPPVRTGPTPLQRDLQRRGAAAPPSTGGSAPVAANSVSGAPAATDRLPSSGSAKERLLAALGDKNPMSADAVEAAEVVEGPAEWRFIAPAEYRLGIQDPSVEAAVRRLAGRAVKITFQAGVAVADSSEPRKTAAGENEVTERALSHPDVKRFQEMFPESQVRQVRNLKESQ